MTRRRPGGALALLLLLLVPLLARPAAAEEGVRVEVRVTYVSGGAAYLDRGRREGLEVGDLVTFEDPVRGRLEARLAAVSSSTSQARMLAGEPPSPGTAGHVDVPPGRLAAPSPGDADETPRRAPEHPPWTRAPDPRDPGAPLLAPAFRVDPADRPLRFRGRAFLHALVDQDRAGDRDSTFSLFRTGVDLRFENPFARGGSAQFAGDLDRRTIDVDGLEEDTEDRFRLDRLWYRWGEGFDSPLVVTLGRFLPRDTPELGLVDGVEASVGAGDLGRFTVDLGALPEPFAGRRSFRDHGATLSWRKAHDDRERLVTGIALQQTWHEGDADRRLALAKLDWSPTDAVTLHGDAWIDFYDGRDRVKDGAELTEVHLSGSWRIDRDHGARASFSHLRWPELLRDEFSPVTRRLLEDNRVTRADVGGWHRLSDHVRLDHRVGAWWDQRDSGVTGDLGLRFPDLVLARNEPLLRVFRIDGAYDEGLGVRVGDRHAFGDFSAGLAYETTRIDSRAGTGGDRRTRHAILATFELHPEPDWSLSLEADWRLGDDQDAVSVSLFLEYRF